jgi:hypothetical protein
MAPNAFDELLTALNPYTDELVYQPTFHLFTKLPISNFDARYTISTS